MSSKRPIWFRLPDGTASLSDDLVETPEGWVQPAPIFCPRDHLYLPGRTVVGWQACRGTTPDGSSCDGHIGYMCMVCGESIRRPEPGPTCEAVTFDERRNRGGDRG